MKKAKALASAALLGLILYSCHYYLTTPQRAARSLLSDDTFLPGGPIIRVKLSVASGAILTAPDELIISAGGISKRLPPRSAPLSFETGRIRWGDLVFSSITELQSTGKPLRINEAVYRGAIELIPSEGLVVNKLSCEEYLLGVVGHESPPRFEPAALRAQAIASRTYVLYQYLFRTKSLWHVTDTTTSQVYGGHGTIPSSVRRAVAETCGLVLSYRGRIFQAYYHATCGGNTTRASRYFAERDIPPLKGTICKWCRKSPFYTWEAEYQEPVVRRALAAHSAVRRALAQSGVTLGPIKAFEPLLEPGDRWARYVRVIHKNGSFELLVPLLRSILNNLTGDGRFRSMAFDTARVDPATHIVRFHGHGCGHGVGLCQYGAQGQALAGRDYVTILLHYYPGATLLKAWPKNLTRASFSR